MLPLTQDARQGIRYPVQFPVVVKRADGLLHCQSKNISFRGLLVSSECLIPEGSLVEVFVALPSAFLSGQGRVVRLELTDSEGFDIAIACEQTFRLLQGSNLDAEQLQTAWGDREVFAEEKSSKKNDGRRRPSLHRI